MNFIIFFFAECRGEVDMKGKGKQLTYWLLADTDKNKVRSMKMKPDESKLKPFFRGPQNLVNNVGGNSQEVCLFERELALLVSLQGESSWKGADWDTVRGSELQKPLRLKTRPGLLIQIWGTRLGNYS